MFLAIPALALAADPAPTGSVTVSRLVVRDSDGAVLGVAPEQYRVTLLEAMRKDGLAVKGAEDVVFDKDQSGDADFVLGGTVVDLRTQPRASGLACEVAIEWKLLDRDRDAVTYTTVTRGFVEDLSSAEGTCKRAVTDAVHRLDQRPAFLAALAVRPTPAKDVSWTAPLSIASCKAPPRKLPEAMQSTLDGVVVIKTPQGVGSGVVVSPDGFVVTAAHVVRGGAPTVTMHDGRSMPADVLRFDNYQDVAVLKVAGTGYACLAPATRKASVGTELFAVGAPGGESFDFSVSKGVVSGLRNLDGRDFVQTDASVNPGNSGGPLLDSESHVLAVVSFKVAAPGFEGMGFGVPMDAVTTRLSLSFGAVSDVNPAPILPGPVEPIALVVDADDPSQIPTIKPLSGAIVIGASFVVIDVASDDAYYPQRGDVVGLTCTAGKSLKPVDDTWYQGGATCDGTKYFFKRISIGAPAP